MGLCRSPHCPAQITVLNQSVEVFLERFRLGGRTQQAGLPVHNDFRGTPAVERHNRQSAGLRFEINQSQTFTDTRECKNIRSAVNAIHLVTFNSARKKDAASQALMGQPVQMRFGGTGAADDQLHR